MPRRRSIYLTDEMDAALRRDGRPIAEIIWAGLLPAKTPQMRARRASRIPDDFSVTEEMRAWARRETPHVGRAESDKFIDYWRSVPGAKGTKLDWSATWRNWMRTAEERAPGGRPVKTRDQEATDQMFDRAWDRAVRKDEADGRQGNRTVGPVRPRALPGPEDG